jgi:hypothetical protein
MNFTWQAAEPINDNKIVRVKTMNHIVEVVDLNTENNGLQGVKKLNKYEYMIKDTGEVKKYVTSENRADNVAGLKTTFKAIRDLINNNFTGKANELHLTLTYSENMTDTKKLYLDYEKFWKRLKYNYGTNIDYLSIIEPQERGAWHCHVLLRFNDKQSIFIPSNEIAKIWGNGFIKIKSLNGVDNIGAYLSAYLGDIELTEENKKEFDGMEIKTVEVEGKSKKFIKGARCKLYPPGMNLYRKSKGIIVPEVQKMRYGDIKKIVGNVAPNYSKTLKITDTNKYYDYISQQEKTKVKELNKVTYQQFNLKKV